MIENLINGHKYIGQSINIKKRVLQHHLHDYKNPHCSVYNCHLYIAIRKYGVENFKISIIEECDKNELNSKEEYWIAFYNTFHNGYNGTEGGKHLSPAAMSKIAREKGKSTVIANKTLQSENHPRAKLTNDEVIHIRQRYIDGEEIDDIYQDYKTIFKSRDVLKNIIFGKSYKYVGNIPKKSDIRYTNKGKNTGKIPITIIKEIRKIRKEKGYSYPKISKIYGFSPSFIQKIVTYQSYKNIK